MHSVQFICELFTKDNGYKTYAIDMLNNYRESIDAIEPCNCKYNISTLGSFLLYLFDYEKVDGTIMEVSKYKVLLKKKYSHVEIETDDFRSSRIVLDEKEKYLKDIVNKLKIIGETGEYVIRQWEDIKVILDYNAETYKTYIIVSRCKNDLA